MGLGVVMVYSSSWAFASERMGDPLFYLKRHAVYAAAGVFALLAGAAVHPVRYARAAYPLLAVCFVLLLVVLIPGVGVSAGIARRWIAIGPFTLQAGEPLKFALIVYLSMSLAKKGPRMRSFSIGLLPHLIVPGAAVLLLLAQPDFGSWGPPSPSCPWRSTSSPPAPIACAAWWPSSTRGRTATTPVTRSPSR
jgi:cell division protein FtsW